MTASSMSAPLKRPATYADLEAVPPHLVAEIIYGSLETHNHGQPLLAASRFAIAGALARGPLVLMPCPELHLLGHVVVPDIAGWRRERMRSLPESNHELPPPDWVCEVVSSQTARLDRGLKRQIYAEAGVSFMWLLEPRPRVLEAFQLVADRWVLAGVATGSDDVKLPPFDAISFSLDVLFPFDAPVGKD